MLERLARWSLLSFLLIAILLACRTLDLFTGNPVPPASQMVSSAQNFATETRSATTRPFTRTRIPTREPTEFIPTEAPPPTELPPTEPPPPTQEPPTPIPIPTRIANTRAPTKSPTPEGPTPTVAPTRCPQKYCIVYRGCVPDAGNTIVEGYVYNNGVPENGVPVRASVEDGGYARVEFISGTEKINPGKPDPNNPGYYILEIVAGAPREGNWWVFVVDVPNGTKKVSEAKLIHTNDDPYNPANCQHAYVDFVR